MKKILIALPLVLIMLLTMIPVSAEDAKTAQVSVTINYFAKADDKGPAKTVTEKATVKADATKTEKELKAAIEEYLKTVKHPEGKEYKTEIVKVTVASQAPAVNEMRSKKPGKITLGEYKGLIKDTRITLDASGVTDANDAMFLTQAAITDLNSKIDTDFTNGLTDAQKTYALDSSKLVKDETNAALTSEIKYYVKVAGVETMATAEVKAVPVAAAADEKKEEKKSCYKACDFITIKVINALDNKELEHLTKKFEVVKGQVPEISAAYEYMTEILKFESGWQIATNMVFSPAILAPENLEDCTAKIYVIPKRIAVNVIHELYNCCKNPDGTISQENYYPYMSFVEEDQYVPFIEFTTQRIINQVKAEEWATTRIQKLNSGEWVFESAMFIDTLDAGRYLTGKVFKADGTRANEDIVRTWKYRKIDMPTIIIKYRAAVCVEKAEEKVDNATVENNNNTTAPVTANGGANLPATGAKDVSAFFLSAVALLGLGIFFAKKH